jgi:hypothetical protein
MASMEYFRRPRLAGNVLLRPPVATVHASLRRNDADVTSAVPYFSGTFPGTLAILLDGVTTYTVTLPDNTYLGAITAINTALGVHGFCTDANGSLSISSTSAGGNGSVSITGGTAAASVGFLVEGTSYPQATGGDLFSTPESQEGNEQSTSFPAFGEALTTEAVNRGLGRVAANVDVLFTDIARPRAVLQQLSGITVSADGTYISLPASASIFTGYGLLSRTSVKEDLAPYFMVLDATSRTPASSKPVALVRGTPSGSLPYANSPSWSDTSGKNVLGLNLNKVTGLAITGISLGRYVTCSTGTFTSTVSPGDVATIAGGNPSPWSNNGMRWIVEAVVSDTVLLLRPMSQSETTLYGFSPTVPDTQPILELNNAAGSGYGTLTVSTGTFFQAVGATAPNTLNLVVSPPIPTGATVTVWAAQPVSTRAEQPSTDGLSESLTYNDMVTSYRTLPDAITNGFGVSYNSGSDTLTVASGIARLDGRLIRYPGKTYTTASTVFGVSQNSYIWYDPTLGDLNFGTSLPGPKFPVDNGVTSFATTTSAIFLVGEVQTSGSAITGVLSLTKTEALGSQTITVGSSGQFSTLNSAMEYINTWSAAKSDGQTAAGAFAHWDIMVVSDLSVQQGLVNVTCPSVRIRGATPQVNLKTFSTSNSVPTFYLNGCRSFVLENLNLIEETANDGILIQVDANGSSGTDVTLRNVRENSPTYGYQYLVQTTGSGLIAKLLIDNCHLPVYRGVVSANMVVSSPQVSVLQSTIDCIPGYATQTMFSYQGAADWGSAFLCIKECQFLSGLPTTSTAFLLQSSSLSIAGKLVIHDNIFTFGAITPGVQSQLITCVDSSHHISFRNNTVGTATSALVSMGYFLELSSPNATSLVEGNLFFLKPDVTGTFGIRAQNVLNNEIVFVNPDATYTNQYGVGVTGACSGNTIYGSISRAIYQPSAGAVISDNNITVTNSGGIGIYTDAVCLIGDNFISTTTGACIQSDSGLNPALTILGNKLTATGGTALVSNASIVTASDNAFNGAQTFAGTGVQNFGNCLFTGLATFSGTGATINFSNCTFQSSIVTSGSSTTISMSACSITGGWSASGSTVSLVFTGSAMSGNLIPTITTGSTIGVSNSTVGNITSASGSMSIDLNGTSFAGTLTLSGSGASTDVRLTDCTGAGGISTASDTFEMSNCAFAGGVTYTGSVAARLSGCKVNGFSSNLANTVSLTNTEFSGSVTVSASALGVVAGSCTFDAAASFTSTGAGQGLFSNCNFASTLATAFTGSGLTLTGCFINSGWTSTDNGTFLTATNCRLTGVYGAPSGHGTSGIARFHQTYFGSGYSDTNTLDLEFYECTVVGGLTTLAPVLTFTDSTTSGSLSATVSGAATAKVYNSSIGASATFTAATLTIASSTIASSLLSTGGTLCQLNNTTAGATTVAATTFRASDAVFTSISSSAATAVELSDIQATSVSITSSGGEIRIAEVSLTGPMTCSGAASIFVRGVHSTAVSVGAATVGVTASQYVALTQCNTTGPVSVRVTGNIPSPTPATSPYQILVANNTILNPYDGTHNVPAALTVLGSANPQNPDAQVTGNYIWMGDAHNTNDSYAAAVVLGSGTAGAALTNCSFTGNTVICNSSNATGSNVIFGLASYFFFSNNFLSRPGSAAYTWAVGFYGTIQIGSNSVLDLSSSPALRASIVVSAQDLARGGTYSADVGGSPPTFINF